MMLTSVAWRRLSFAVCFAFAAGACEGTTSGGGRSNPTDAASPADGNANADARPDAPPSADVPVDTASPAPDAPMLDVGGGPLPEATPQLPRTPADPRLTRRLVPGPVGLVGSGSSSCSHQAGATGDLWCAFHKKGAAGKDELWAFNANKAAAGVAVACEGDGNASADCRRLTDDLWTGTTLWGPSHPTAHRFEDDTLLFHTGANRLGVPLHEGGIWAWRPAWAAPRRLTSDRGAFCTAQPGTSVVVCAQNVVLDKDPTTSFDRPRLREYDLLAGVVGPAEPVAGLPLSLVGRRENLGADAAFRVRISPSGEHVAFSRVAMVGGTESVEVIRVADIGKSAATVLVTDGADWEIAHDGAKLYHLTGVDRRRGERATGTLAMVDFPAGGPPTTVAENVYFFERLGGNEDVIPKVDGGLALLRGPAGQDPSFALMLDRNRPDTLLSFAVGWNVVQIATDRRHTLYFRQPRNAQFPVAYVARNDGSQGWCQLTTDARAETYGTRFADNGKAVFWIEFGRAGSESEEGWYARPETCDDKVKFGDFVFGYRLASEDFIVFEGGDIEDTTSWLQYTSLKSATGSGSNPLVIKEKPDPIFAIIGAGPASKNLFAIFSTAHGGAAEEGLYIHGPLKRSP